MKKIGGLKTADPYSERTPRAGDVENGCRLISHLTRVYGVLDE